jgi:glycosyltransferase involved in cell wall biosynthesis
MVHELAVVMPVHNEEACVAQVVESWLSVLTDLQVNFLLIVLDDGSTDNTAKTLDRFADDTRVCIVHQANAGHGPTIIRGYRQATNAADWVFQCDSDNEMSPESFSLLWEQRSDYDAVFGYRQGRQQSQGRSLVSFCSRLTVRLLFGAGVRDVNTPYRLIRSTVLEPIIERVPPDTFAPNILISGAIARAGVPILNIPVPCRPRQSGCSINTWKLSKGSIRSFAQTWQCRKQVASAIQVSKQNDASCERRNPAAAHRGTPNGSLSS